MEKRAEQLTRMFNANKMIDQISECGRKFFFNERTGRTAYMFLDQRGRVWFFDEQSHRLVYTHHRYQRWKHFSHGGTLHDLVDYFRDYIKKGELLPSRTFGPWPGFIPDNDLWGYGEAMELVREKARELGILKAPKERG